jgi:RNA polymerase sigma-70 factor (ECF subfamily)
VLDAQDREHDNALVQAAQAGDRAAFGELVDRLKRSVHGVCMSILRNETEAMDAVQDTFLKVWTELARFQPETNFRAWVHRIARNGCLDRLRRQRVRRAGELNEFVTADALEEGDLPAVGTFGRASPLQEASRTQLGQRLAAALELLPESHRTCVVLCDVEGLSYQEIADTMGIPRGTVMSRLFYARKRLQAELQDLAPSHDAQSTARGEV